MEGLLCLDSNYPPHGGGKSDKGEKRKDRGDRELRDLRKRLRKARVDRELRDLSKRLDELEKRQRRTTRELSNRIHDIYPNLRKICLR